MSDALAAYRLSRACGISILDLVLYFQSDCGDEAELAGYKLADGCVQLSSNFLPLWLLSLMLHHLTQMRATPVVCCHIEVWTYSRVPAFMGN